MIAFEKIPDFNMFSTAWSFPANSSPGRIHFCRSPLVVALRIVAPTKMPFTISRISMKLSEQLCAQIIEKHRQGNTSPGAYLENCFARVQLWINWIVSFKRLRGAPRLLCRCQSVREFGFGIRRLNCRNNPGTIRIPFHVFSILCVPYWSHIK